MPFTAFKCKMDIVMGKSVGRSIYKGWWIVLTAFVGLSLGYAILGITLFSLMMGPLIEEFGWQRADISLALTLYTSSFVIFSIPMGRLMDHFGVRAILLPSLVLFGLGLGSMYFLTGSLMQLYGMYFLLGIFSVGTIPSSYTKVILNWFDERRGLALALALAGVGAGAVIMPPIADWMLSNYGWRYVYVGFSLVILCVCFPLVVLFLKEKPQGAEGYSEISEKAGTASLNTAQDCGPSFIEALQTRSFLIMFVAFVLLGIGTISILGHLVTILMDKQISPTLAALGLSVLGASSFVARIVCGYMLDRFFAPYVAVVFLVCPVVGILMLITGSAYPVLLMGILLFGIGGGAEFDLMSYLSSRYLGLKSYSQIYGAMFAAFYIGGGGGAWMMGRLFDQSGSYQTGMWGLMAAFSLALILLSRLGRYPDWTMEKSNDGS